MSTQQQTDLSQQHDDQIDIVPRKVESVVQQTFDTTLDQDQFSYEYDQSTPKLHISDILTNSELKLGYLQEYE